MQTVIIIIHLIVVLALIAVVLLQRSEGGLGLGGGGSGGSGFMTGRGQANALTRATAILAGLFFVTSLVLSVFASFGRAPRSILDTAAPRPGAASPQAPAGAQGPGVLEELQRMQGNPAPATPAPANPVPTTPTPPQVPQSR